jgi:hypothetical protein
LVEAGGLKFATNTAVIARAWPLWWDGRSPGPLPCRRRFSAAAKRFAAKASFFDVSNFSHKSVIRTALSVKRTPPLVAGAHIQYTKETKAEKASKSWSPPKNPQKSPSAAIAHMNDLLDEALKETFPAFDLIAINVELESPDSGIATTPWFRAPLNSTRKAPWRR